MRVLIVSNRYPQEQNTEFDRIVTDAVAKGWKVISAVTTTTYLRDKATLSWDGVLYTTTIVLGSAH